jgi:hypothetical protein
MGESNRSTDTGRLPVLLLQYCSHQRRQHDDVRYCEAMNWCEESFSPAES